MSKKDSKVITSDEEFDDIDIDLGDDEKAAAVEEVATLDEVDVNPTAPEGTPTDEDLTELETKVQKDVDVEIDIEIDPDQTPAEPQKDPVAPEPTVPPVLPPSEAGPEVKKRRGRPKGSKKKGDVAAPEVTPEVAIEIPEVEISVDEIPAETTPEPQPAQTEEAIDIQVDDIDIEIDINDLDESKAIKAELAKPEPEVPQASPQEGVVSLYEPDFQIEKIKTDKYQTRATNRNENDRNELIYKIKMQGQLEPVHIVHSGDEYQLLAGFGRVEAMKFLKQTTVKALVYENLTDGQIFKISTGTNLSRLEFTEWDKIMSVGNFAKNHPDFANQQGTSSLNELAKVFGFHPSAIYKYLSYHAFYSKHDLYKELFAKIKAPSFVLRNLYEYREEILDHSEIAEFIKKSYNETQKVFIAKLQNLISDQKIKNKIENEELEIEGLDETPTNINKEKKRIKELVEGKALEEKKESRDSVIKLMTSMNEKITEVENMIVEMTNIEDYKMFLKSDMISKFTRAMNNIGKLVIKLV